MNRSPIIRSISASLAITITMVAFDFGSAADRVEFRDDIIPVLTKNGCNAGACHGAAIGRGGFKLSLYGGDPDSDYLAIVRQRQGRRINLASPELSLLLQKPTEQVAHEGGSVFDVDSESQRLIQQWIASGAGSESTTTLERVDVSPVLHVAKRLPKHKLAPASDSNSDSTGIRLNAVAHYSDDSVRDVTAWTIFTAEDSSAVQISDSDPPTAKILRPGRHIVIARYLGEVVPLQFIMPFANDDKKESAAPHDNFIDAEVSAMLATLGLPVSPIADDSTFLRRISLHLTGRLPTRQTAEAFLADTSPDKRTHQTSRLLESDAFNEFWTFQLAKLLRIRPSRDDLVGFQVYHRWLAAQVASDTSYREIARSLLQATGDSHEVGAANFYRTTAGAREQAEFVSELFMGSRLRCANCHNHPLDRWTQDDYHGLAAIFAKVGSGRTIQPNPRGEVIHPRTRLPALARIPGERFLHQDASEPPTTTPTQSSKELVQLADWLTDDTNPYFAKAIVNRLWKHMLGRGLVEPADDFRSTNPATHPALLERLADDFLANDCSIRHTLRRIALSQTYARSSEVNGANRDDNRFYSHRLREPLGAEVLSDAISDVLGVPEQFGDTPSGTRAISLVNPNTRSTTLDILGRCDRKESCEDSSGTIGGLSQKLHLFNGDLLNQRIAHKDGRLHRLIRDEKSPTDIIHEFYQLAFSRLPTEGEMERWRPPTTGRKQQLEYLEDFVWALLSCNEFSTNH